jgi:hypothetical protein
MELCKIELDKSNWSAKEVSRIRIPAPGVNDSYCEKNWYPILDKPYHFVKWTSPAEIVRTYPDLPARCDQVSHSENIKVPADQRGGSQLIRWNNLYLSITHEVNLFNNYLSQKDGVYRHRLCVWDDDLNLVGMSPNSFSFLDARIEFAAGAARYNDDLLISFGFQDNAAFVLKVPNNVVEEIALRLNKTAEQVLLKWALQNNAHIIPSSQNPKFITNRGILFRMAKTSIGLIIQIIRFL